MDVPTLRELIDRHTDRTGESRRALGDRGPVAHQTLSKWWNGAIHTFPDPETLDAFAHATNNSLELVVLATARTLGLPVSTTATNLAQSLPPGTDILTLEDRDAILAVTRALVDARRQTQSKRAPDLDKVEGLRLAEDDDPTLRPVENRNGSEGT